MAITFAETVGNSFGLPNFGGFVGPFFIAEYVVVAGEVSGASWALFTLDEGLFGVEFVLLGDASGLEFAVGQEVPEPLTIIGSLTAAGFGVAFKKRKKDSNKV